MAVRVHVASALVHCRARHTEALLAGPATPLLTALWHAQHYQPVVDEVRVADPTGHVQTWRRTP